MAEYRLEEKKEERSWLEYYSKQQYKSIKSVYPLVQTFSLCNLLPQSNTVDLYLQTQSNCQCIKYTAKHLPKVTYIQKGSKLKQTKSTAATRGKNCEAITPEERLEMRYEKQRWQESIFHLLWQTKRKTVGHRRERRRQGVEETAETAKWCRCGVRKPCVLCRLIGRWGWGGLRPTDQRDLQGFAPSSVEAACQPLPL